MKIILTLFVISYKFSKHRAAFSHKCCDVNVTDDAIKLMISIFCVTKKHKNNDACSIITQCQEKNSD